RSRSDPILLNNSEMVAEGNGDLPVPDLRTMEELCQPSLNGRGGLIAPIAIQVPIKVNLTNHKATVIFSAIIQTITKDHQGANQGQKKPPAYQAAAYQAPVYQAPVHQPQIPQPQVVTTNEFTNFIKENDAILKNMQTNMTSLTNSNLELKNMFGQFMKMNIASSSSLGTLLGNTITNPKEDLKGITTRSETAYKGPTIPTTSSSPVVERETKVTKDTVHPTNNGSTEDVQPSLVQSESLILNSEPVNSPTIKPVASPVSAPKPNQRPLIPYPSRLQDQKLRDKANDQREKFFQIFKDLNFNISFADALILMPKFGPSIKSFLTNKDKLYELARTPLNEHYSTNKLSLPDLSPTCMTLELADHSISHPVGVAEDVYVKVGTFHFPADFIVVDFDADPRVPLILGRYFLKTGRALIDVFEEVDEFLAIEDDPTSPEVDQSYLDSEGDILLLEAFLNDDPSLPPPNQGNYMPEVCKELKICKAKSEKSSIDEPPEVELKDLPPHLEYAFLEGNDKLPVIIANDLSVEEKTALITVLKSHKRIPHSPAHMEHLLIAACFWGYAMHQARFRGIDVDKAKVDAITKLPHPTTVKGIRSFLGHAGFYQRFIKDFSKIARLMTRLLEKDSPFLFSNECVESFQTLKRNLTKAPILIAPDWDMPFELMCDASDFAIDAVLRQRQEKHFRPIHYAIKTMTEAESNYTTMEKETLVVVYAFEKFRSYLIMNKSIVYTNHFALKYLFAKKDSNARLLCWVLLLHVFTFKVIDTKGAENLAADHLSRLENPHQNVLDAKEINESFPLETLNLVSTRAYKTPYGCTPYKLVYGKACHLPIEIEHKAYWALKHANFDLQTARYHRKVQLNELRDQAYESSLVYKEKTKRLHDSKIKHRIFNIGDRVLLFNF
nr:DNA-directed DNA polymerase [Tanacetum cinerariifolium]